MRLLGNRSLLEEAYDVIVLEDWTDSPDVKCPDSAQEHPLNQIAALEQPILVDRMKQYDLFTWKWCSFFAWVTGGRVCNYGCKMR